MVSKSSHIFEISEISGLTYTCHDTLIDCRSVWLQGNFKEESILQEPPFLNSIAHNFENKMQQFYVVFSFNDKVVGRALFQCGLWEADASYKDDAAQAKQSFSLKSWFAKKVKFIGILCGNILLTGEYGFSFDYSVINKHQVPTIISKAAKSIEKEFFSDSKYPTAIIAKDLLVTKDLNQDWIAEGYHHFEVQPNMIMDIDPEWKD